MDLGLTLAIYFIFLGACIGVIVWLIIAAICAHNQAKRGYRIDFQGKQIVLKYQSRFWRLYIDEKLVDEIKYAYGSVSLNSSYEGIEVKVRVGIGETSYKISLFINNEKYEMQPIKK